MVENRVEIGAQGIRAGVLPAGGERQRHDEHGERRETQAPDHLVPVSSFSWLTALSNSAVGTTAAPGSPPRIA